MYICFKCRTEVPIENPNVILSCPKCSGRVFFKSRPKVVITHKAR
ncbi:MAG: DNA-directed RNA polymerase subunit P [DPANN group archaeon]|nr:DNA-directed RNA polymerase subunit P [DPANN group archaeon]